MGRPKGSKNRAKAVIKAAIDAESMGIVPMRVIKEVGALAFSNVLDFVTVGKDGHPFVDWSKVTREQATAISGVQITERFVKQLNPETDEYEDAPVRTVKFTLWPKEKALELLGKYFKLWETAQQNSTTNLTIEHLVLRSYELHPPKPKPVAVNGADPPAGPVIEHEPVNGGG